MNQHKRCIKIIWWDNCKYFIYTYTFFSVPSISLKLSIGQYLVKIYNSSNPFWGAIIKYMKAAIRPFRRGTLFACEVGCFMLLFMWILPLLHARIMCSLTFVIFIYVYVCLSVCVCICIYTQLPVNMSLIYFLCYDKLAFIGRTTLCFLIFLILILFFIFFSIG